MELDGVQDFFDLQDWPHGSSTLDLGGCRLEVIPSPGHHESSISVFDPYTGLLFSGDTAYPGRLDVRDMAACLTTIDRLAALAESGHVSHVLGGHIELDQDGRDCALGDREHPMEASPFMSSNELIAIRDAARTIADSPGVHPFDGFVIKRQLVPGPAAPSLPILERAHALLTDVDTDVVQGG